MPQQKLATVDTKASACKEQRLVPTCQKHCRSFHATSGTSVPCQKPSISYHGMSTVQCHCSGFFVTAPSFLWKINKHWIEYYKCSWWVPLSAMCGVQDNAVILKRTVLCVVLLSSPYSLAHWALRRQNPIHYMLAVFGGNEFLLVICPTASVMQEIVNFSWGQLGIEWCSNTSDSFSFSIDPSDKKRNTLHTWVVSPRAISDLTVPNSSKSWSFLGEIFVLLCAWTATFDDR